MENSSRMNGKNENTHSRAGRPARVEAAERAQLYVDEAALGVNVRIPDPAGGDGWIATTVSLTTFADASDGEILATGLSTETDRERVVPEESSIRNRPEFRSAVERWVNKHATMP